MVVRVMMSTLPASPSQQTVKRAFRPPAVAEREVVLAPLLGLGAECMASRGFPLARRGLEAWAT